MYLEHYGLAEPPFSITPDPRFVFLSERHRDALAHLLYGIGQGGGGGFVQLTGEVGTGKTTLSRLLLEQLPENTRVALVLNPRVTAIELLETICEELRLEIDGAHGGKPLRGSAKGLVDALNAYLLDAYAQGLRVVLIVDEAQNLSVDALEQVRLLTNLETDTQKLLQIVLLGQPELRTKLARDDLRQLAQRITARFHLTPLDAGESAEYLRHRFRVAGGARFPFDATALRELQARSGGVPRLLNVIAERSLLAGYARDAASIDQGLVAQAADEALPSAVRDSRDARMWPLGIAAGAIVLVALLAWWRHASTPAIAPAQAAPVAAQAAHGPQATRTRASSIQGNAVDAVATTQALATRIAAASPDARPAWAALLALWSLPADRITVNDDGTCTPASDDVRCLQGHARLDKLLALDRPVLLPLHAGSANAWAVLLGADARHARLMLGGRGIDVDRLALQDAWDGRYATIWRGPAFLDGAKVASGRQGPAVAWVAQRLGVAAPAGDAAAFDSNLAQALRRFQGARGLAVDGVAGPETMLALANDGSGPHLSRALDSH